MQGRDYFVRVSKEDHGIRLEVDRELQRLLQDVQVSLRQRLDRSSDVPEFLAEFKDILERIALGGLADAPPRADAMRCIVEEIEGVGWERVHAINEQLQVVLQESERGRKERHATRRCRGGGDAVHAPGDAGMLAGVRVCKFFGHSCC